MVKWTHHKADTTLVNALISRYRTDNFAIFKSEGEKHAFVQSLLSEKSKAWSSQGQCYFPECTNKTTELPSDESRHATKSLRLRNGDAINILNGKGDVFEAMIDNANENFCEECGQSFSFG